MTGAPHSEANELVRTQAFPADGPLELDLSVSIGRFDIRLDEHIEESVVELRHDPTGHAPWAEGVTNILNWVSDRFTEQFGTNLQRSPTEAISTTRIDKTGNRLVVHGPKALPLRNVALAVTVRAPAGSRVEARTGAADVSVAGAAGHAEVSTGSGQVTMERTDGPALVRTGSGVIKLGCARGGLELKTGSGAVEISSLSSAASVVTGTGDVWLGTVSGDALVRSGSGTVSVAGAETGSLELLTGSGQLRISLQPDVWADVDLSSGSGKVTTELDVAETPPEADVALRVRGRTGSGDTVLATATSS